MEDVNKKLDFLVEFKTKLNNVIFDSLPNSKYCNPKLGSVLVPKVEPSHRFKGLTILKDKQSDNYVKQCVNIW